MFVSICRLSLGAALFLLAATTGRAQYAIAPPGSRQPVGLSKPRIAPLPESQWTDVHRQVVAKYASGGHADNGLRTLLNLPELALDVMPYTHYLLEESSLPPRQRELLVLRVAWLCGSQPLWASHATRARTAGLSATEIRRIAEGPDASGWAPFESTLLRLADQLFKNSSVTDATWQALSARYDMFNLMDAVETVNHFVVLSVVYNSFGVQPDDQLRDRLPRDVTYRVAVPRREPPITVARVQPAEGRGIAVTRTFSRYPTLHERWSPRQNYINRTSKLTPGQREMLILRMGWNCQSEYEWAKHVGSVGHARDHGLDPARIAEGPQASVWNTFERSLLRASDELYHDGVVSDETWRVLSERFGTGLMMSTVLTASVYRAISMSLNTYGVQLEEGDERFPQVSAR